MFLSEIRLPQPGKHTQQTLAKNPSRRKLSLEEMDVSYANDLIFQTIFRADPSVLTAELTQTHLARARAVKRW